MTEVTLHAHGVDCKLGIGSRGWGRKTLISVPTTMHMTLTKRIIV